MWFELQTIDLDKPPYHYNSKVSFVNLKFNPT